MQTDEPANGFVIYESKIRSSLRQGAPRTNISIKFRSILYLARIRVVTKIWNLQNGIHWNLNPILWNVEFRVRDIVTVTVIGFFLIVILEDRASRKFFVSIRMGKDNKFEKNFLKISSIWNVIIEDSVPNKRNCAFIHYNTPWIYNNSFYFINS